MKYVPCMALLFVSVFWSVWLTWIVYPDLTERAIAYKHPYQILGMVMLLVFSALTCPKRC